MDAFIEALERQVSAGLHPSAREAIGHCFVDRARRSRVELGAEECRYNYTTLPQPRMGCLYLGENTERARAGPEMLFGNDCNGRRE